MLDKWGSGFEARQAEDQKHKSGQGSQLQLLLVFYCATLYQLVVRIEQWYIRVLGRIDIKAINQVMRHEFQSRWTPLRQHSVPKQPIFLQIKQGYLSKSNGIATNYAEIWYIVWYMHKNGKYPCPFLLSTGSRRIQNREIVLSHDVFMKFYTKQLYNRLANSKYFEHLIEANHIFVRFISNFLCMCSNSMASAHVILK